MLPLLLFLLPILSFAQDTGTSRSIDSNKVLGFKKIYIDTVQDNVEGLFQKPFIDAYKEVLLKNPRFEIVADQGSSDTVIRTKVEKRTTGIDAKIQILLNYTNEIFSTDQVTIASNALPSETKEAMKGLLRTALKHIPFYGTITGRDKNQVTLDIGTNSGLKRGDIVQVSRVGQVQRHPLLKTIIDVQMLLAGSVELDAVEANISFGYIKNEVPGEQILNLYKVTAIEARKEEAPSLAPEVQEIEAPEVKPTDVVPVMSDSWSGQKPQIGYVSLGALVGALSNSTSRQNGTTVADGSTFAPGARFKGELWLTKNWFFDLGVAAGISSYTHKINGVETNKTFNTSTLAFNADAGYRHLISGSMFGPQIYGKLGYSRWGWNTPTSSTELLGSKTYSGLNLGIGGAIPVQAPRVGVLLDISFLLFPSISEDPEKASADPSQQASAFSASFFLGAYYYLMPTVSVQAGFLFESYSADFTGGSATSGTSTTAQKQIGLVPSIVYYF